MSGNILDNINTAVTDTVKAIDHGMENLAQSLTGKPGDLSASINTNAATADNTATMVKSGTLPDVQIDGIVQNTRSDFHYPGEPAEVSHPANGPQDSKADNQIVQNTRTDFHYPGEPAEVSHPANGPQDSTADNQIVQNTRSDFHYPGEPAEVSHPANGPQDSTADNQIVQNTRSDFHYPGEPAEVSHPANGPQDSTADNQIVQNTRSDFHYPGEPAEVSHPANGPQDSSADQYVVNQRTDFTYPGEPTMAQFTEAKGEAIGKEMKDGASDEQIADDITRALQNGSPLEDIVKAANKATAKGGIGAPHLELRTDSDGNQSLTYKAGFIGGTTMSVNNNEVSITGHLR